MQFTGIELLANAVYRSLPSMDNGHQSRKKTICFVVTQDNQNDFFTGRIALFVYAVYMCGVSLSKIIPY